MKLELKESNCPYWIIGTTKNKTLVGSDTNIPCYYNSKKKQYDLAVSMFNRCKDKGIENVYIIDGYKWDNMPSGGKEEFGYLQNKGTLLKSANIVTPYESKYEVKEEADYPKDVSREALPKKGAKIYTSTATALEKTSKVVPELKMVDDEKDIKVEAVPWKAIATGAIYAVDNWDTLKDMIETIKSTSAEVYDKIATIFNYLKSKNVNPKDAAKDIANMVAAEESMQLKESTIVTPVGNPQTASSFVNIDVDLDHMEVSDFIVRLTQAIRSEQTAILEYVALRSANGITNEDRSVIDGIIDEEKNHLAAITTLLYKQILVNHPENVDKANTEFTLPKFGADVIDEKANLKESVEQLLTKVESSAIRISDDYYIGDNESGRIYHGLGVAMDVIKNIITKSGEPVTIQNTTIADDSKMTEDIKVIDKSTVYEVEVDVDYDSDNLQKLSDALKRAIDKFNKTNSDKYTISNESLQSEKLTFKIDFKVNNVSEDDIKKIVEDITKEISTYDIFIVIK